MEQQLTPDEMYGIAKKINRDLEQFPMHTHSAMVEMIRVGMQHRNLALQAAEQQHQKEQQERVLKIQEQQAALSRMAAERQAAGRIQLAEKPGAGEQGIGNREQGSEKAKDEAESAEACKGPEVIQ